MLQTIREHTQGWIAGVIISIIILTFALWGIHSYFVGGGASNIVAAVNGVDITKEQLASAYERLRRQIQQQYGPNNPIISGNEAILKERALQGLVEIEVLKQAATDEGFFVSPLQVDGYIQSLPDFQVNGAFSSERFQQILAATMLSPGDLLELIRTSLLIEQPKLGIIYSSVVLPKETTQAITLVNQEREIEYMVLPMEYFLKQPMTITNADIKQYYEQHKPEFMSPEQVSVDYLTLSINDLMKDITPSNEQLQSYYQENTSSYTSPMQWKLADIVIPVLSNASAADEEKAKQKADAIYKDLQANKDFDAFAKQYPSNFTNKGWLNLNQIPADLQKTVADINTLNTVAPPVRTKDGFVIVKALEIKQSAILPYDEVKNKVKESYVRMHAEEKFAELRDQLADAAYEHPDSLQFAAKKLNLSIQSSDVFSKETEGKGIAQYKKVRELAFSNEILNMQNNSDVIQVTPDTAIVMHLKTHAPSVLQPMSAVSNQIADKLKAKQAEKNAEKMAFDLKNKLQAGENPQQIAETFKFTWNMPGYQSRYSDKIDSAILETAFRMPQPNAQKKTTLDVARLANGYAIIALKSVQPGKVDEKQKQIFAEQIQNSEGLLEYELYKQGLKSNAKIKIDLS